MHFSRLIITSSLFFKYISVLFSASFPAEEFFNISKAEISNYSHYLCHVERSKKKCCSCKAKTCYQNCCIDVHWVGHPYEDLESYLQRFIKLYDRIKIRNTENARQCNHVIYPLLDNHSSELIFMTSTYNKSINEGYADCPLNLNTFNIPAYSFRSQKIFINRQCAELNGEASIGLNYLVKCSFASTGIQEDGIFDFESHYKQSKCRFELERPNYLDGSLFSQCSKRVRDCNFENINYNLCQIYLAQTGDYKNPHCMKCIMDNGRENSLLLNHPSTAKTCVNDDTTNQYPITFNLIPSSYNNAIRIRDLDFPFPARDFLPGMPQMGQIHLNLFLCERPLDTCCSCTPTCFRYRTCCMDILWDRKHPVEMSIYKNLLLKKTKPFINSSCEPLIPSAPKIGRYFLMVASCPSNSPRELREQCKGYLSTKFDSVIPVIGENKYVYRNRFCAMCNDVRIIDVINITMDTCLPDDFAFDRHCDFAIHEDDIKRYDIQSCHQELENTGNCSKENPYYDLCHAYSGKTGKYKNHFCDLCNNITLNRFSVWKYRRDFLRWSFLLSFSLDSHLNKIKLKGTYHCVKKESGRCTKHKLNENKEIAREDVANPDFTRCIEKRKLTLFIVIRNNKESNHSFLLRLNLSISKSQIYHTNEDFLTYRIESDIDDTNILQNFEKGASYFKEKNISLVFSQVHNPLISELHSLSFESAFPKGICLNSKSVNSTLLNFTSYCDVIVNSTLYTSSEVAFQMTAEDNEVRRQVYICQKFFKKPVCNLREAIGNLSIDGNGTLTNFINGELHERYTREEYYPLVNGAAVCMRKEFGTVISEIERYVTIVGTPLSCLCYILMIPVIWSFNNFQNLPGKCSMALISNLLLADSAFFAAGALHGTTYAGNLILCRSIAILTHFGLTMSHAWSSTISFDMMVRFSNSLTMSNGGTGKFACYAVAIFLYSILLVGSSFWLDITKIIRSGYGINGICTFHLFYGRLYFYIIPTIISFCLTVVFSLISICNINNVFKVSQKVLVKNQKNRRNLFNIVVKLILVLGISEGIGFIQIASGKQLNSETMTFSSFFNLVYSFLRSLRGVFLFIVYVCKGDTRRIIMNKFCGDKRSGKKKKEKVVISSKSNLPEQVSMPTITKSNSPTSDAF